MLKKNSWPNLTLIMVHFIGFFLFFFSVYWIFNYVTLHYSQLVFELSKNEYWQLFFTFLHSFFFTAFLSILLILPVLICIAFFTIAERKIMAGIQRRRGPNVVGFWGILQPFADGLKALLKEIIFPYQVNKFLFLLAPSISFILSLLNWAIMPFSYTEVLADLNYGLLYIYAFSSLAVYGIILAGWVSKSKYPFLGAIRSAAQMISYEVSIGLTFLILGILTHSLNLMDIVYAQELSTWYVWTIWPQAVIFFISSVAETNRAPFDIPEAEAEIVAGYNLEYSSMIFAFFFIGEYGNILIMSSLFSLIFLGGWLPVFSMTFISPFIWFQLKTVFVCFLFVLIRATIPRYRHDQIMGIGWEVFLPFNILYLISLFIIFLINNYY